MIAPAARRPRRRGDRPVPPTARLLALTLLAALLTTLLGPLAPWSPAAHADTRDGEDEARPLVVVGFTGVRWDDVSPEATPSLWRLGVGTGVGNLVVRSVRSTTCPADGWLAVSSGARAADLAAADRTTDDSGLTCRPLEEASTDGAATGATVPGWADYAAASASSSYDSRPGLLGDELRAAGVTATAIGPGAAIALATSNGAVAGTALPRPEDAAALEHAVRDAMADSAVLVVDVGSVRDWVAQPGSAAADEPSEADRAAFRAQQVAVVDALVGEVLSGVAEAAGDARDRPLVVAASLADSGSSPALQVIAADGLGPGTLTSTSTRQPGYVQATDLTPWFLRTAGIARLTTPSASLVGSAPYVVGGAGTTDAGEDRIAALVDANDHAQAQRPLVAPFYLLLVILNVILYAGVALGLSRQTATRLGRWFARWRRTDPATVSPTRERPRVLRTLRVVAVAMAAIPVSTFLANLLPWWRVEPAGLALAVATLAICAVVTAGALVAAAAAGRRRASRHAVDAVAGSPAQAPAPAPAAGSDVTGSARPAPSIPGLLVPMGVVAGLTALVLAVDVATGARLQLSAVMGVPVLVAGRFYGFNNTAFALFTTACILLCLAVTNHLVRRGQRAGAAAIVAIVGLLATVLDGAPGIGADFGGPPAIIPAFALLALMAAGVRITWGRVLAVVGAAVAATAALAVLDYLRPAEDRTHLGGFVQTVLDGGAWDVVGRKLEANLRILANNRPLTILAIAGVALVVLLLARPVRSAITSPGGGRFSWLSAGARLSELGDVVPMLRPGFVALAVALGIGFAVNDSGIAIPAYGVALAVPLLLATCASWLLTLAPSEEPAQASAGDGER